jgi:hypothetical protein
MNLPRQIENTGTMRVGECRGHWDLPACLHPMLKESCLGSSKHSSLQTMPGDSENQVHALQAWLYFLTLWGGLLYPFYRWGHCGSERLRTWPKVTQLMTGHIVFNCKAQLSYSVQVGQSLFFPQDTCLLSDRKTITLRNWGSVTCCGWKTSARQVLLEHSLCLWIQRSLSAQFMAYF